MYGWRNFTKNGFTVLYDGIPNDITDNLRSMARDEIFWIHDTWDGVL
ncbi:hypothetical protein PC116_g21602 [Phytophthora cactorum]|uniref:Uncharacterized protein n=1 Tax=Phytophthora cactorum TaxID=29920 RepID=A0A8T1C4Y9_9STRA|nr:hypothetical protein PC114_g19145 [Phytophthora cactorum]KAG2912818.1 hypothetical protein PC117_g18783 [Phytophthora cactorum]KAG3000256.1 hypothetical protein PC120_g20742 [Phytophthora cactorum]KAG3047255.1 hypothetical protein PC121_g20168 [Phytophthora cactorum]KAG3142192.1 hypothetical protein C6341_g19506 [Phytophthora cactorum]